MARLAGMETQQPEVARAVNARGRLTNAFNVVLLAAGVAGCAGMAAEKEQQPKEAFPSFSPEWRAQGRPVAAVFGSEAERKEVEDWRAWQDWKRKNPK